MVSLASCSQSSVIKVGYMPLVESAPFLVAQHEGLFEKYGISVVLQAEQGWRRLCNNFIKGELDAVQCPAHLTIALSEGIETPRIGLNVPMILNANGSGITLGNHINREIVSQSDSLSYFLKNEWKSNRKLTFAVGHPHCSQYNLLVEWLKSEGVDPDHDVNITYLSPSRMIQHLKAGHIDGYCVGEPWNSVAVYDGVGWCVTTSADLVKCHPEKVLAFTQDFYTEREYEAESLTASLIEACKLCADPAYRLKLLKVLQKDPSFKRLGAGKKSLANSLFGNFVTHIDEYGMVGREVIDFHKFYGRYVNSPNIDTADWLAESMNHRLFSDNGYETSFEDLFRMDIFERAWRKQKAG